MNPYDELEGNDDDFEMPPRSRKDIPAADLELLRLAARAIGAELEEVAGEQWVNLHFDDGSTEYHWNPLVHGDNALNVAVQLNFRISIECASAGVVTIEWDFGSGVEPNRMIVEPAPVGSDNRAATRRAITRAAAEIGKNLK